MNLLIIDMQPQFLSSVEIIPRVQREIKRAIEQKENIIYVEYIDDNYNRYSRTHPELTNLTRNYDRTYGCFKRQDDGSQEVYKLICRYGLGQRFRVCGVQSTACVYYTVNGILSKIESEFVMVADALNAVAKEYLIRSFDSFRKLGCDIVNEELIYTY